MTPNQLHRFEAKIERVTESGCWIWTGALSSGGYGQLWPGPGSRQGRKETAHRLSYEHWRGSIPEGLELDHLCRVRCCVNPWHLRAVTGRDNRLAPGSLSLTKINAEKTHCNFGHAIPAPGTEARKHYRECRECRRMQRGTARARELHRLREQRRRARARGVAA